MKKRTNDSRPVTMADFKQLIGVMTVHFDKVDKRFNGIDKRLDGMDIRFSGIEKRLDGIDKRLDGMDKRLDGIEEIMKPSFEIAFECIKKLEDKVDLLGADMKEIKFAVVRLEENTPSRSDFSEHERRIKKLELMLTT